MLFLLGIHLMTIWSCNLSTVHLPAERERLTTNRAGIENSRKSGCGSELPVINNAVKTLLSGRYAETEAARSTLLARASKSRACRSVIVGTLMTEMDKPGLDFERQSSNYFLWREGSTLLGELEATEALDLLIRHLHLTTGYHSASQVFRPAIRGVLKMGLIAIPKLNVALRQNSNADIRMGVVYCLTSIGGHDARTGLKIARASETNKCVSRFIDVSLATFVYKSKSGKTLFNNRAPQADSSARMKWLLAFECNEDLSRDHLETGDDDQLVSLRLPFRVKCGGAEEG